MKPTRIIRWNAGRPRQETAAGIEAGSKTAVRRDRAAVRREDRPPARRGMSLHYVAGFRLLKLAQPFRRGVAA